MTVGLIDVDGHHFPNLALMRISAYCKKSGVNVEWWDPAHWYDSVYMSKIFSDAYSDNIGVPMNAGKVVQGGTGYCIHLEGGKEKFDANLNIDLPSEVENCFPDYSIYPEYTFAVAMTSRGCPRGCGFCHVAAKEGRCSRKVADLSDFYAGQDHIEVLDPNITACKDKRDLFAQYRELCVPRKGPSVTFSQGLDIRLTNQYDLDDLNHMRVKGIHFAWDNPNDDLEGKFREFAKGFRRKSNIAMVYCLTNFGSTMEENLHRVYTLRDMGYDPYVMVYDKPHAPQEILDLQRWCNNKVCFKKCKKFEDYVPTRNMRRK